MNTSLQIIEKNISTKICDRLDKVGILYRTFSRTKNDKSISEKITRKILEEKPYSTDGKKMQDIIGVRIVTYFQDDIKLVKEILSNILEFIDEEIDTHELTVFKPKRTNIICAFDSKDQGIFNELKATSPNENLTLCDTTFELQLRTILSEGWHEVDHSLRYKCKNEWEQHAEKERMLNGIYASLEVNDLALKSLFIDLAYQHFKLKNWEAMLRHKFRLRFQSLSLKEEIIKILNENNDLAKKLLKIERETVMNQIANTEISIPINFNNIVFLINHFELKDEEIYKITPELIKDIPM